MPKASTSVTYSYMADADFTLRRTAKVTATRLYDDPVIGAETTLEALLHDLMAAGVANGELTANKTLHELAAWFLMKVQQMGGATWFVTAGEGRHSVTHWMPDQ